MKKKLLTLLLALLVMFSATVALIPNTVNKAKASDTNNVVVTKLNSEEKTDTKKNKIRYKIMISTNYYTPKYCKKAILHYGVNGWDNVQEKDMTRTGSFEQGSGIFTTYYTYETIVTVNEGDTIDYCFKFLTWQDREGWINNENNDYHVKVDSSNVPCSYTVEYDKPYHEATAIEVVDLCYTLDNWETTKYNRMEYHSIVVNGEPIRNFFDCTVHGYETDTLEYCFRILKCNGQQEWDNNNGANYRVSPLKEVEE